MNDLSLPFPQGALKKEQNWLVNEIVLQTKSGVDLVVNNGVQKLWLRSGGGFKGSYVSSATIAPSIM